MKQNLPEIPFWDISTCLLYSSISWSETESKGFLAYGVLNFGIIRTWQVENDDGKCALIKSLDVLPVDHGVMLEVTLNDAFRCSTHNNYVIARATSVSILSSHHSLSKNLLPSLSEILIWYVLYTCNFWASSQLTPSKMCDWGPALMPPWRRFSLICFCFCLNSFDVVPIGTNWWAISNLNGVLLCVGEPSGTHCNYRESDEKNKK